MQCNARTWQLQFFKLKRFSSSPFCRFDEKEKKKKENDEGNKKKNAPQYVRKESLSRVFATPRRQNDNRSIRESIKKYIGIVNQIFKYVSFTKLCESNK